VPGSRRVRYLPLEPAAGSVMLAGTAGRGHHLREMVIMRFLAGTICLLMSLLASSSDEPKAEAQKEAKKLRGTWLFVGDDGMKPGPIKNRVVVEGNKLTVYDEGKVFQAFTFMTGLAIYELKGDTLRICVPAFTSKKRPTEFKDSPIDDLMLWTLKRKKE
jgi:hypothetical protein